MEARPSKSEIVFWCCMAAWACCVVVTLVVLTPVAILKGVD
jgi:hypothetical protein